MSIIANFFNFSNDSTTLIDAYSFRVKAYESIGDFAHGDYVVLNKVFVPSEKIEYHFYNNFLIIYEQTTDNYIQYLNDSNTDKDISYQEESEESSDNKIYNLKQIQLKSQYVQKLKQYYNLDKQRKILFEELKNM